MTIHTWPVADNEEIERDGGLVLLTDVMGTLWRLTLAEAKSFPFGIKEYRRCRLVDKFWYPPID